MSRVTDYSHSVAALQSSHETAKRNVEIERKESERLKRRIAAIIEAQEIAQLVAQTVQEKAHGKLAAVVTRCLRAVFEDDAYEFCVEFERKRGKTEARLFFTRDGQEIDPMSASGGGPIDVAAFALRLAALVLSRPLKRRVLFLDEAMRFVSKDYWPQVREMIEAVAEEMGVQIVLVTHQEGLVAGTVVRLER